MCECFSLYFFKVLIKFFPFSRGHTHDLFDRWNHVKLYVGFLYFGISYLFFSSSRWTMIRLFFSRGVDPNNWYQSILVCCNKLRSLRYKNIITVTDKKAFMGSLGRAKIPFLPWSCQICTYFCLKGIF